MSTLPTNWLVSTYVPEAYSNSSTALLFFAVIVWDSGSCWGQLGSSSRLVPELVLLIKLGNWRAGQDSACCMLSVCWWLRVMCSPLTAIQLFQRGKKSVTEKHRVTLPSLVLTNYDEKGTLGKGRSLFSQLSITRLPTQSQQGQEVDCLM